ncbi:MAG: Hsp33 family molecular chaperone HslO, partial [Elainellaceae cyanobacterium]
LQAGKSLPQIFQQLLGDMGLHIFSETQMIRFHCGCSFERMLGAIKLFGIDDLEDMIAKDDGAEATCHFCGTVYQASVADLGQLIEEIHQDKAERQAT